MHRCRQTQNPIETIFQFNTTILSNEVTPRSDRHQNQQMKQICIILQIIVNHFKYKIFFMHIPTTNTMHNLATWTTYKMYQSYILGLVSSPNFTNPDSHCRGCSRISESGKETLNLQVQTLYSRFRSRDITDRYTAKPFTQVCADKQRRRAHTPLAKQA